MEILLPIRILLWGLRLVLTAYAGYFVLLLLFSIRSTKRYPEHEPSRRFAIIIPARNEEAVIGSLVESLLHQHYPRGLFEVFVFTNNCSDGTGIAALAAGARVVECTVPIHSKGDVLSFAVDSLLEMDRQKDAGKFDAFIVFDADNVVHPGFLVAMNNAACTGVRVAQGYRDSKNPGDTLLSGCTSVYYWAINHFINRAKSVVGLSAMINGTGFMVDSSWLLETGGWQTTTMTEDIEYSTQVLLRGEKIAWVPCALTYDEQPLTFRQSWHQRKRWSSGNMQGLLLYGRRIVRGIFQRGGKLRFDLLMNVASPIMQMLYVFLVLVQVLLEFLPGGSAVFPGNDLFYRTFLSIPGSYLAMTAIGGAVVLLEGKNVVTALKGILTFGLFIVSWIPINLFCLFRTDHEWREIRHTRRLGIEDLAPSAVQDELKK